MLDHTHAGTPAMLEGEAEGFIVSISIFKEVSVNVFLCLLLSINHTGEYDF